MNTARQFGSIVTFRHVLLVDPHPSSEILRERYSEFEAPGYSQDEVELAIDDLVAADMEYVRNIADAAAIVFCHSILEDVVKECAHMSIIAGPDDWNAEIESKQIRFSDLLTNPQDRIRFRLLKKAVDELVNSVSLTDRIQALIGKWKGKVDIDTFRRPYRFDVQRLKAIDKVRQDIVHRVQFQQDRTSVENSITFLEETSYFVADLLATKYGLRVDVDWYTTSRDGQFGPTKRD